MTATRTGPRRVGLIAVAVVCVATVILVILGLAARDHSGARAGHRGPGRSERAVLAALAKTGATGHFDVAYALTEAPPVSRGSHRAVSVTGAGTVRIEPFAMTISAHVSGVSAFGVGIGDFSISVDAMHGSGSFATGSEPSPGASGAAGSSPLSANEGLVEGALGPRVGAVAMMGLASPTGLLDLAQPVVTGAAESGTGTVNSFLVTDYKVSIDVTRLGLAVGTSPEERAVLGHALALLHQQGYRNTTVSVAIDAAGLIRRATSVTHFADGGSVSLERTLSNFGPVS